MTNYTPTEITMHDDEYLLWPIEIECDTAANACRIRYRSDRPVEDGEVHEAHLALVCAECSKTNMVCVPQTLHREGSDVVAERRLTFSFTCYSCRLLTKSTTEPNIVPPLVQARYRTGCPAEPEVIPSMVQNEHGTRVTTEPEVVRRAASHRQRWWWRLIGWLARASNTP